MKKKIIYNEKKTKNFFLAENFVRLLPRLYREKGFLYCSRWIYIAIGEWRDEIVLQLKGLEGLVYCNTLLEGSVLQ